MMYTSLELLKDIVQVIFVFVLVNNVISIISWIIYVEFFIPWVSGIVTSLESHRVHITCTWNDFHVGTCSYIQAGGLLSRVTLCYCDTAGCDLKIPRQKCCVFWCDLATEPCIFKQKHDLCLTLHECIVCLNPTRWCPQRCDDITLNIKTVKLEIFIVQIHERAIGIIQCGHRPEDTRRIFWSHIQVKMLYWRGTLLHVIWVWLADIYFFKKSWNQPVAVLLLFNKGFICICQQKGAERPDRGGDGLWGLAWQHWRWQILTGEIWIPLMRDAHTHTHTHTHTHASRITHHVTSFQYKFIPFFYSRFSHASQQRLTRLRLLRCTKERCWVIFPSSTFCL